MAKRRRTSTAIVRTVPYRPPAPIIRVQAPRAAKKKTRHRRHHHATLNSSSMQSFAIGGFLYGVIEKNFAAQLPTLPLVGRAGSIAIAAYLMGKGRGGGIIADVGKAAAVIAGYQFGTTGKISGLIAPQVHGVAAQV